MIQQELGKDKTNWIEPDSSKGILIPTMVDLKWNQAKDVTTLIYGKYNKLEHIK